MNEMRKLMESANKLFESMSKDERSQLIGRLQMALDAPLHRLMALSDAELLELARKYLDEDDVTTEAEDGNPVHEALEELQELHVQLYEISERVKSIMKEHFPEELYVLERYGALDFGSSSNPHDVTFQATLDDLLDEEFNR